MKEWFSIRTDLFFNLLKPTAELIKRLDAHYLAFYVPYMCECQQGMSPQWVSRFAEELTLACAFCGKNKIMKRDDMTTIHFAPPDN